MINHELLFADLQAIRAKAPLIHNITNYVVMNNTANALLAIGASPVMAHATEEVKDLSSISSALVLNIGTLSAHWVEAMKMAGKAATERNIPVVFDPVGAGASEYRTNVCREILEICKPGIIRGNASEIMALADDNIKTKGVDSCNKPESALETAMQIAKTRNCIVVISGAVDFITDGENTGKVLNGHEMMTKITGMGCTATAITGAFAAVNKNLFQASLHAMAVMGIAGEMSAGLAAGPGSMQMHFTDSLFQMNQADLIRYLKN